MMVECTLLLGKMQQKMRIVVVFVLSLTVLCHGLPHAVNEFNNLDINEPVDEKFFDDALTPEERLAVNNYVHMLYEQLRKQDELYKRPRESEELDTFPPLDNTDPPIETLNSSWSIIWYIASFSGLIVFFLVISCSEWCCRRKIRNTPASSQNRRTAVSPPSSAPIEEVPPPAYEQFAPPSYESLTTGTCSTSGQPPEKSEFEVYVVPLHAMNTVFGQNSDSTGRRGGAVGDLDDVPPSYAAASNNNSSVREQVT